MKKKLRLDPLRVQSMRLPLPQTWSLKGGTGQGGNTEGDASDEPPSDPPPPDK